MGFFDLFKFGSSNHEKEEEFGVADRFIDYVVDLIEDKESIGEIIKVIEKVRKLSLNERRDAYVSIYLKLENILIQKKPPKTKEYFSKESIPQERQLTREDIRETIMDKIEINKLGDKLKVLFIKEPQQSLIFYEILCQEFINSLPESTKKKVLESILKNTRNNILEDLKINNNSLDFSVINTKKTDIKVEDSTTAFKDLFSKIYNYIIELAGKKSANELIKNIYNFAESYGTPLSTNALKVLPRVSTEGAELSTAQSIVKYVSDMVLQEDLIRPLTEKIQDVESLPKEEKENVYFHIYLELEKFIAEHSPPAVKKQYTSEELRQEIKQRINILNLKPQFKILFLRKEEQIIELFIEFYKIFIKKASIIWDVKEIQKKIIQHEKEIIKNAVINEKIGVDFGQLESTIENKTPEELELIIKDLEGQYEKLAEFLSRIRKDITIIISPGNHDGIRLQEPQPMLDEKYAWSLYDMENVVLTGNPAFVNFGATENFGGFNVLLYHGFSYPYYADSVPKFVKLGNVMNQPTLIMKHLLMHRHLAPDHKSVQSAPLEEDGLLIRDIPDIFVSGHTHKMEITYYNNILVISAATWEKQNKYQERMGNKPDFCKIPMLNLKTGQVKILDFENIEEELGGIA